MDAPNATGAPVLCLHGLFAGAWVFDDVLGQIAERGYPAYAMSFRGHPPDAPLRNIGRVGITDYCADASAVARALDRPIVIGHSLGGLVALMLTGRNLARAAILVSPSPPRGVTVFTPRLALRMARHLPAMLLSRALRPSEGDFNDLVLNAVPQTERAVFHERFVPDSGRAARQAALGVFKVPPRALRAPMLVVGGSEDRMIPAAVSEKVAALYSSPLHIAQGHGHMMFAEPGGEQVVRTILNWMDALPRSARDPDADVGARQLRVNSAFP